jgi:DNA-binding NarL/FixJ family response regulator
MSDATPLRVLIVDDQRLMRVGLRTLLELEGDLEVVGEAGDGLEALVQAEALEPDVVLMDVRMPELDGVAATRQLLARRPQTRVLILTTFDDDALVFEGLRAGALGYLLKDASGAELAAAVRSVAAGSAVIGPSLAGRVLEQLSRLRPEDGSGQQGLLEPLSERERQILALIAEGLSNGSIAYRLELAEGTVKNYVSAILQKTGSRDRTQAVLRARELGLV